jgi:DNA polymerase I
MPKTITAPLEEFLSDSIKETIGKMPWMKEKNMKLCESLKELHEFIDKAIERNVCVLDLETTGLNTRVDKQGQPYIKIVGISLAYDVINAIYIPINHKTDIEYNLPELEVMDEIRRLCRNCVIIAHHAKYDFQVLKNEGIIIEDFEKFEDTLILARLYDAGQKDIGLKSLSEKLLGQPMIDFDEITGGTKQFTQVSPSICYIYAASDAVCTFGLYEFFMTQPTVIEQKGVYNLEKRLVFVVMQMEANLVKIDKEYLKKERIRIAEKLEEIENEVQTLAGEPFNVASTLQLGRILFEKLKYRYPDKEKTAKGLYKTDGATLEKISDEYPIVKKIITYREMEKALGTYVENLINNCDEDDCVKFSFNQNGTDTGRFSSPGGKGIEEDGYSAVNVQSIPAKHNEPLPDIRKAFIARPGKKIVAIDFSGEELRVAANLSGEKKWIDEFLFGSADLHTATAKAIFKKEEITPDERKIAKKVNFLVLYGGGPRGLSEQTKISENEARRILTAFFEGLPQLDRWIKRERKIARERKKAVTAFKRIRPLDKFYDSGDKGMEAHADRCATNFLVQGSSADIIKTVMVRVSNWIKANHLEDEIKLLITMHDELVFEMPSEKLHLYIPPINDIMCLRDILQGPVLKWPVPLTVDAEYGDSWHVTNDFFKEHPELRNNSAQIMFHQEEHIETIPVKGETVSQPLKVEVTDSVPQSIPMVNKEIPIPVEKKSPEPSLTTEEIKTVQKNEESEKETNSETGISLVAEDDEEIVYIIQKTMPSTAMWFNSIINFLNGQMDETQCLSPKKTLRVFTKEGYELTLSKVKVRVESFSALVQFFGL